MRAAVLGVIALAMLAVPAAAQKRRVLHVWVDPHYGVDSLPLDWNPGPAVLPGNRCASSDTHPHNVSDGDTPSSFLLHAPAPFRTVTAAIAYVRSLHPNGLPHLNTTTTVITQHVVIHCLPGVYGPGTGTEAHSGLDFNGEVFPILLPPRVSIQGTSAMNTVFIGDGLAPVFEFGSTLNAWPGGVDPGATPRQFLANIGITGAIRTGTFASVPEQGAAIFLERQLRTSLLVANCFIYANAVGLLVDAATGSVPVPTGQPYTGNTNHVVFLVNNTFAWNVCGIWNGVIDRTASPAALNPSLGLSLLCLANNLFDSTPPLVGAPTVLEIPLPHPGGRTFAATSSWGRWSAALLQILPSGFRLIDPNRMTNFEGMDMDDIEAQVPPGPRTSFTNYNGLQFRRWNIGTLTVPGPAGPMLQQSTIDQMTFLGLHQTSERNARPANPSRNTEPFTASAAGRGILFVRDLLHEGARTAVGPFWVPTLGELHDVCVGDFRLSPGARLAGASPGSPPTQVNPMVDQGFTFLNDAAGNPIPLPMWNSLLLTPDPFDLVGDEQAGFPHHPWNWDCEGFGNLRVFDHPIYPNALPIGSAVHTTDIGADEVDLLIMNGYRQGTTTFVAPPPPPTIATQNNNFQWFLAASEGLTGAVQGTVPATLCPVTPLHSDYLPVSGWSPGLPASYYQPRYVDVVPHLLPDIHPWHSAPPHTYPTNVFWQSCSPWSQLRNIFNYQNPSVAIINPVGTYLDVFANVNNGNWLDSDLLAAAGQPSGAVPWMNENGSNPPNTSNLVNTMAVTGGFCFLAEVGAPVTWLQPSLNPRFSGGDNAMRVSCEFVPGSEPWANLTGNRGTNLQTFMIWRQP